jgi:hypothetical protein
MCDLFEGKVYKLICNGTGLCYIGSTTQSLQTRLRLHENHFKQNQKYYSSYEILKNKDYKIELIETCNDKANMLKKERYYQDTVKCVNKRKECRQKGEYYQENKERLLEKASEKVLCTCGKYYTMSHKSRHLSSKYHVVHCITSFCNN